MCGLERRQSWIWHSHGFGINGTRHASEAFGDGGIFGLDSRGAAGVQQYRCERARAGCSAEGAENTTHHIATESNHSDGYRCLGNVALNDHGDLVSLAG